MSADPRNHDESPPPPFQLLDLNAPVLSGPLFRLLVLLLESPLLGHLPRRRILYTSGFLSFRARAASAPTALPTVALPLHRPLPPASSTSSTSPTPSFLAALLCALPTAPAGARPTIASYHRAYATARLTPTAVAHALLALLPSAAPLGALHDPSREALLAAAAASTARWAASAPLSALDGVPFVVKASLHAAPFQTTCASGFAHPQHPPAHDADVVRALRSAGMLLLAKAAQDELGLGVRGFSPWSGQVRNPHDLLRVPGGSSAGCAAAVAAALCPVAVGTDSGGSVRIPAACCGVYGMKPTFARLSTAGRILEETGKPPPPAMHVGPMAAAAPDLVLVYAALAAFAPHRPIAGVEGSEMGGTVLASIEEEVRGLRVAVYEEWARSSGEKMYARMRGVVDAMVDAGATEVPVVVPDLEDVRVAQSISVVTSFRDAVMEGGVYENGTSSVIGLDTRGKLAMAAEFTEEDKRRACQVRAKAMKHCVEELFQKHKLDVLVTPALGIEPPPVPNNLHTGVLDVGTESKLMKFSVYANCTGIPACTIPIGRDDDSMMPFAVQVMAGPWNEQVLLQVALWAEKRFQPHRSLEPKVCFDVLQRAATMAEHTPKQ